MTWKHQLTKAWNDIPVPYIQILYSSLPNCVCEVLLRKEQITKHHQKYI